MTAVLMAGIIGGPLSGALLSLEAWGLAGWQWLFLLEGLPAVLLGCAVLGGLQEDPGTATWLTAAERDALTARLAAESSRRTRPDRGARSSERTGLAAGHRIPRFPWRSTG